MQKILIAVLISLVSIFISSSTANAQPALITTGTLRGAVTTTAPDGLSYNVPGASLKLKTPSHTLDAVSDDAGEYQFTNLIPGTYALNATVEGFKTQSKIVTIRAGETSVENLSLEAADVLQVANPYVPAPLSGEDGPVPATSTQPKTSNDVPNDPTARLFQLVLPSAHLFGDWGGLRSKLEEKGITPRLIFVTDLAGNPRGGRSQGVTAPSSFELSFLFDLEKIFGLKGGSIFASFSERWGHSLSAEHIGNTFSTQQIHGFQTWRVLDVSYQQKLFEDRVELRLGRFAAMDDFLVSPYNFGFMQNAFCGNPFGILLNAPGMSAYYGTWAALGKVKPTKRSYVMTGVYNGDPRVRENKYHGVNLSMKGPLFSITEAGYQINGLTGDSRRLGNYKVGAWYDRSRLADFESGASKRGSWGYYGLFDQVLIPFGSPSSNRGFGVFGSATVAPSSRIQQLPLFVTAGVSARGLFDARPRDAVSFGVASGYFSDDLKRAQRNGRLLGPAGGVPDRETVLELTYRFDLRNGAFFIQPDLQYINRSGGVGHFKNATVVGAQFGINF
jgi:porin